MIDVTFTDESSVTISSIDQWTTGNMLKVSGLSLNDKFTVSYSHSAMSITDFSVDRLGRTYDKYSVVPIPNRLFTETGTITVSFDEYSVIVPVTSATKPTDYDSKYKCDTDTDACMIAELVKNGSSSPEITNLVPNGAAVKMGYQIDGKDVYCKMMRISALWQSGNTYSYDHNIGTYSKAWIDYSRSYIDYSTAGLGYYAFPLTFYSNDFKYTALWIEKTKLYARTTGYWNIYNDKYVTIIYY